MERIPPIDVQLARLPIGENDRRGCWGRGGAGTALVILANGEVGVEVRS